MNLLKYLLLPTFVCIMHVVLAIIVCIVIYHDMWIKMIHIIIQMTIFY